MPSPDMNCFSVRRSCATSSALALGRTGTNPAKWRAVATATFSNSKVTASTLAANLESAARSSKAALVVCVATSKAGPLSEQ